MEADYLVVGSGASAMAFVDEMLTRTDADFVMFDRRPAPGGHWNDAYPHVRLHQPAATYGVASRPLGSMRIEADGPNRDLLELSSGVEITNYFHGLMRDRFLPSGRVRYFPLCERTGPHGFRSLLSGETHEVEVRRKIVDASYLTTNIPMTHRRGFEVADGVACEPPNHLPRRLPEFRHVAVLGAGKTAIDAVVWLLSQGWPVEALTWVVPRDGWYWMRDDLQPAPPFFERTLGALVRQNEALASTPTVEALGHAMEAAGTWARLTPEVEPGLYHAATLSRRELEVLRRVRDPVRLGRVTRLDVGRIHLQKGERGVPEDTLFVDCTASIFDARASDATPVFSDRGIALKMIRLYQPCLSAALIAFIEATIEAPERRAGLTRSAHMTDTVADFARSQRTSMENEAAWAADPDVAQWLGGCRLNPGHHLLPAFEPGNPAHTELMGRLQASTAAALENLSRLDVAAPS